VSCCRENMQEKVSDVERNGYCFSDGVGCISPGKRPAGVACDSSSAWATQWAAAW
jgi:hypothetical protein